MDTSRDLMTILRICQDAGDEQQALARVCTALRERLRASLVAVIDGSAIPTAVAAAGAQPINGSPVARRVIDSGLVIAPVRAAAAMEAGAPVRYAGAIIGAILVRWPMDATLEWPRVEPLLFAAAAACAATLRSSLDGQPAIPASAGAPFDLLGVSDAVEEVRRSIHRAASAPFTVLIEGESGSGKELVARAVHRAGPRRDRKLCAVNCAALSDELIEAELFGHCRGAFTGALTERVGLFEEADGGTLFLDEVSELSARAQAKLLRVIQEGEIRRVGENFPRRVDARLIAATNRALRTEVSDGRFRQDLLYRLDVIRIVVPPLRDRPEDVPVLAARFWAQSLDRTGTRATLDPATLAALARYDWPGNVRELQNVMAALAVRAPRRGRVGPESLPETIAVSGQRSSGARSGSLDEARRTFEQGFVRAALARTGGHRGRAATDLGVSRQGLSKLILRLGLDNDSGN